MKKIILISFFGILIRCQLIDKKGEFDVFKTPSITNSQFDDSIKSKAYQANHISEVFPTFIGKFKFQDEIDITPKNYDTINEENPIYEDYIYDYSPFGQYDTIDVNGLELLVDYETTVKYNRYFEFESTLYHYFPVYFINSTNTDKAFYGKDGYVFGIQEAKDGGEWRPIEGRGFDFCGNGRWGLIVHPREFILILMRKYEGDYETKMRVRFEVNENIFVSSPFIGKINKNQFSIQDSSYLERRLQETGGKASSWLFYGAIPKGEDWVLKAN